MAKHTSLAWLLLSYISLHALSVRTAKDPAHCPEEGHEEFTLKNQTLAAGGGGQHNDKETMLHKPLSTFLMLYQGAREIMSTENRLTARSEPGFNISLLVGGVLLSIVLAVVLGSLCHGVASTKSVEESDDDSDDSVLVMGDGLGHLVWLNKSASSSMIVSTSQVPVINMIVPPWSSITLDNVFKQCGLEESWMEGKNSQLIAELRGELSQGESSFFSQGRTERTGMKCITYMMQLALHYVPDDLVLQEIAHTIDKTICVTDKFRLPQTTIHNVERIEECLLRCFTLELGVSKAIAEKCASRAILLRADHEVTTRSVAAKISNVSTSVQMLTVLVQLEDVDDKVRKDLGIDGGILSVDARGTKFRWEKADEDSGLQKLLRKSPDARKVKPKWKPSGVAVLPWSASDVWHELSSRGIAPSSFGQDLQLLMQMLKNGEIQLGVEELTGKLVCVEHRVYLKLSKRNGDFLVEKGNGSRPPCLPYVQVLANEPPLVAALRAARTKLGSVFMRVELKLRVQDVHSTLTPEPPDFLASGQPMKYVVREFLVEALARA